MNKQSNKIRFTLFLFYSCGFPSVEESGLRYSTSPTFKVPQNIEWQKIGFAKEKINIKEKPLY